LKQQKEGSRGDIHNEKKNAGKTPTPEKSEEKDIHGQTKCPRLSALPAAENIEKLSGKKRSRKRGFTSQPKNIWKKTSKEEGGGAGKNAEFKNREIRKKFLLLSHPQRIRPHLRGINYQTSLSKQGQKTKV